VIQIPSCHKTDGNSIKGEFWMEPSIAQIRAARALLGWSQGDLADAAALSRPTVERAERTGVSDDTQMRIRLALEKAGVEFTNGDQPGVRLRKAKRR
jgi:transcriptional regulator with XRE-family HTH domain